MAITSSHNFSTILGAKITAENTENAKVKINKKDESFTYIFVS